MQNLKSKGRYMQIQGDVLSKRKPKNSVKNLTMTLQVKIDLLVNKLEYTNIKETLQA